MVGQVLSIVKEPQTNGKTINWCQVRVVPEGQEQTLTGDGIDPSGVQGIICGAHNFVEGDKVVVTLPGAVLPGDFRISARKTYGHLSAGMIASVRELGIGEDHDGILVLSRIGLDPEIGTDAMELLGLYDQAAEINVTPDRGYAFSIRGVAREYAHATGTAFTDPAAKVQAPDGARRRLRRQAQRRRPHLRQARLRPLRGPHRPRRGRHPAHPAVDGLPAAAGRHPLHLAARGHLQLRDARTRASRCTSTTRTSCPADIVVRRAVAGEKLTTLDGKERTLDAEDLLITDGSGAIGIAGVMGGAATEVGDSTSTILVEAAHFDEVSIARSRRRHKLPSEASKRFERGVDWHVADVAAQRAVDLLVELAGGTADARRDRRRDRAGRRHHRAAGRPSPPQRIGIDFTAEQIVTSLEDLGADGGKVRRRLDRHGPELAERPGDQGGPDRGNRPAGGLRQDPGDAAGGASGPRPDPRPAAAPPRHPGPGRRRPHRGAVLPVRLQGRERHLRRRRGRARPAAPSSWPTRSARSTASCAPPSCRA